MSRLRAFGLFWVDFIVGDDWLIAAGVVVLLGLAAALARSGVAAWWVTPAGAAGVLWLSVARAARRTAPPQG